MPNDKHLSIETLDPSDALYPGQWRLARVELANWGTFNGYHAMPVDRRGLLITGDSGSGKSTLLDAIATVLTPPANLSLNAAANNGGKRDSGRSISNYVRGAFGNLEGVDGEVVHSYLRDRTATWSGIMLRYEDGIDTAGRTSSEIRRHEPMNLLAIFFQKANTSTHDGLRRFYAYVRGDHALSDFQEYGRREADMTAFNKDFQGEGKAWRDHASFESRVCNMLHIESPKTLVLLHKTQAAKNIGSLDDLFRTYMLEEPMTFELARDAVEQFAELDQAHDGVVEQRSQMECLEPLAECDKAFGESAGKRQAAESLERAIVAYTEERAIALLDAVVERKRRDDAALIERIEQAETEQRFAKQELASAEAALNERGGLVLDNAAKDVDMMRQHRDTVQANRSALERELAKIGGFELPGTREDFEAFAREIARRADEAQAWIEMHENDKIDRFASLKSLIERISELDEELRFLRGKQSNIPRKLDSIRNDIVRHLGISPDDAPFLGELIDVKPQWAQWRGAIERLIGSPARTMLVSQRFAPAINDYLESRHLGTRFDYDAVPDQVETPPLPENPDSLVRRLDVKPLEGHEQLSRWAHKTLRERFDYTCVERPAEMELHERAITVGGQIKVRNHHTKDDRYQIDDRSRWVLGSSNDEKIALLEGELAKSQAKFAEAKREADDITAQERKTEALVRLSLDMAEKQWEHYNLTKAESDLASAQAFRDELAQSSEFKQLEERRKQASLRSKAADEAVEEARVEKRLNDEALCQALEELDKHRKRLESQDCEAVSLEARAELDARMSKQGESATATVESIYRAMQEITQSIARQKERAEREMQAAMRESEKIMDRYRTTWSSQAADLTSDFSDREAYLARLRQIKATRLPDYERRFLDVLTSFSQDQITVIASEIRGAFREVRERLEPVNSSLRLSEYEPGVFLQIEVSESRNQMAKDFLADLAEVTSGSWENDDLAAAEKRYERTSAVMRRLGSSDPADASWRRNVLDTSRHMRFTAKEVSAEGEIMNVHSNDGGLSGGQKQKLVFFCLAAALRYQLADEDQPVPAYGTVILDEAFDKSDRHFAAETLSIFKEFGFHMVLATPGKLLQAAEDHIGSIVIVTCKDHKRSALSPVTFEPAVGTGVEPEGSTS